MRIFSVFPKQFDISDHTSIWYVSNTDPSNFWSTLHHCMIRHYRGSSWVMYSGTFRSWVAVAEAPIVRDCRSTILDGGLRICIQWLVDPLTAVESAGDFRVHQKWRPQCFVHYHAQNILTCIPNRTWQGHNQFHRKQLSMAVIAFIIDVYTHCIMILFRMIYEYTYLMWRACYFGRTIREWSAELCKLFMFICDVEECFIILVERF